MRGLPGSDEARFVDLVGVVETHSQQPALSCSKTGKKVQIRRKPLPPSRGTCCARKSCAVTETRLSRPPRRKNATQCRKEKSGTDDSLEKCFHESVASPRLGKMCLWDLEAYDSGSLCRHNRFGSMVSQRSGAWTCRGGSPL